MNHEFWWLFATALASFQFGYGLARLQATKKPKQEQMPSQKLQQWHELPSGWSQSGHGLVGYVIEDGGVFCWWLTRNGRTLIEGPARTLDLAKEEVGRAMLEMRRGA